MVKGRGREWGGWRTDEVAVELGFGLVDAFGQLDVLGDGEGAFVEHGFDGFEAGFQCRDFVGHGDCWW